MEKIKFFISSTIEDLENERQIIKKLLKDLSFDCFLSEEHSSDNRRPEEVCLNEVCNCDIFILIIGQKYGYKPSKSQLKGSPYDGKISATHGEFIKAKESRKPILVFAKDIPDKDRDEEESEFFNSLTDFLDGQYYSKFDSMDKFKNDVKNSISLILVNLIRNKYVPPWKNKPNLIIASNETGVASVCADILGRTIINIPNANIGLSAGKTASSIYHRFFKKFSPEDIKNIKQVTFFSVTEHFGVAPQNHSSYAYWFEQAFFKRVKKTWDITIEEDNKKLVPSVIKDGTIEAFSIAYDQYLQIKKVDLQIISAAPNGQIISIDPVKNGNIEAMLKGGTSLVEFSEETAAYLVPKCPHTMDIIIGMDNLLTRSDRLVVPFCGVDKREVVNRIIFGPIGTDCPASLLRGIPEPENLLIVIDEKIRKTLPNSLEHHVKIWNPNEWMENFLSEELVK